MAQLEYEAFQLKIDLEADGYRVDLLASPVGEASCQFQMPTLTADLQAALDELHVIRRGARSTRKLVIPGLLEAQPSGGVKAFGVGLFGAVFGGKVGEMYRRSLDRVRSQGKGLRIQLISTPALSELPWEYLRDPTGPGRFLFHSEQVTLARYLGLDQPVQTLAVKAPLRILVMISNPNGVPPLEVDDEWGRLQLALKADLAQNRVILNKIPATLEALSQALGNQEYHVLHFIGHGGFDEQRGGLLLLEDAAQNPRKVDAETLASQLQDERTLRLVVLNACESARATAKNPFSGIAQTLVEGTVPAVVAMQFEISDDVAITFSENFYGSIVRALPVDTALADARKAIFGLENGKLEFGIPVLYMRSSDGRLFDVEPIQPSPLVELPRPEKPDKPQQGQPWWQILGIGFIFACIVLLTLGGVRCGGFNCALTAARKLVLMQPPIIARAPNASDSSKLDPTDFAKLTRLRDSRMPKISDAFNFGTRPKTFDVDVKAKFSYFWRGYWCRSNQTVLNDNLKHIEFNLLINNKPIKANQVLINRYTENGLLCQQYATVLEDITPGTSAELVVQAELDQAIHMGDEVFQPGIHRVTYSTQFK